MPKYGKELEAQVRAVNKLNAHCVLVWEHYAPTLLNIPQGTQILRSDETFRKDFTGLLPPPMDVPKGYRVILGHTDCSVYVDVDVCEQIEDREGCLYESTRLYFASLSNGRVKYDETSSKEPNMKPEPFTIEAVQASLDLIRTKEQELREARGAAFPFA